MKNQTIIQTPSAAGLLAGPTAAAGAVAAAIAGSETANARMCPIPSIAIPKEIPAKSERKSQAGPLEGQRHERRRDFLPSFGCREEELARCSAALAITPVINAMAAAGVPAYGGRPKAPCAPRPTVSRAFHRRSTACSGTEGRAFTHMIMNIASGVRRSDAAAGARQQQKFREMNVRRSSRPVYQQPITTG